MTPLNEICEVTYGNKLDLNKLERRPLSLGGINFVGRSSQNHGVSGSVAPVEGIGPYEAGLITVALGGSKLLSAFVQEGPFYTAQNVAVLRPFEAMTFEQKVYLCLAIRQNRFRYSAFGREANRTLRTLLVPCVSTFPGWISDCRRERFSEALEAPQIADAGMAVDVTSWRPFMLGALFDIRKGKRLTKADMVAGSTPFIGASDAANGLTARVGQAPIHEGGTISLSYNGSVAEAFYQSEPYWATDDVNVLYPQGFSLTAASGLFVCTVIRREKFRFNYGRKWHLERMREAVIRLPVTSAGQPDWGFMERYMKTLAYSSQLMAA
ncbi:MAG: restriction endonuclease subunit S [Acetobacter syzygii]|uniref:restriction endonuclease subunit S n=1 Tax=Acetobacteraceae TaxID=433 RepID=UPI0039EAF438